MTKECDPCIWYICRICRRAYQRRKFLIRHKRETHPKEKEDDNKNKVNIHPDIPENPGHSVDQPEDGSTPTPMVQSESQKEDSDSEEIERINLMEDSEDEFQYNNDSPTPSSQNVIEKSSIFQIAKDNLEEKSFTESFLQPPGTTDNKNLDQENGTEYGAKLIRPKKKVVKKSKVVLHFGVESSSVASSSSRISGQSTKTPLECRYCLKKFHARSILAQHERAVHEGQQDFICVLCTKAFSHESGLKRHVQKLH